MTKGKIIDTRTLLSLLAICRRNNVRRFKWEGIEIEFDHIPNTEETLNTQPSELPIPLTAKEFKATQGSSDPDLEMPEDMLHWSTPLTVIEEPNKKSHE